MYLLISCLRPGSKPGGRCLPRRSLWFPATFIISTLHALHLCWSVCSSVLAGPLSLHVASPRQRRKMKHAQDQSHVGNAIRNGVGALGGLRVVGGLGLQLRERVVAGRDSLPEPAVLELQLADFAHARLLLGLGDLETAHELEQQLLL